MTPNRSSSKHDRRRLAGRLTVLAALAIAFAMGDGALHHRRGGPPRVEMALGAAGQGGGLGGGQGGGFGHWRARHGAAGTQNETHALQTETSGAGEGDERSPWGGFMPNDEDGLVTLADFVRDHGGEGNPNPGTDDGAPGGNPDGQVGSNGPPGGGFTAGGGYTGGGGGGGGGPGGGTPNRPTGGNGDNGGGGNGGGNGGTPGDPGGLGPIDDGGDDGAHKPCVLHCGQSPGDGSTPKISGPTGDTPLTSVVPEPATWMMLILGFGALGLALRAQRRKGRRAVA
ncbi:MAG: hypothetical protein JWP23_642 [Phenylobacterium sp.]|nr:hypothetical protein [Phenylobacterium sp.]